VWKSKLEFSDSRHLCKVTISDGDEPINFARAIAGWKTDPDFRQFYFSLIANLPFEAIFWESPPITPNSLDRPYEFVAVNSVGLAKIKPNPSAFKTHFDVASKDESVIAFENLGKDALLIVPCPQDSHRVYPHLAKFLREGSKKQCHELFRKLAEELEKKIERLSVRQNHRPLWINTSGLGVYWLHLRLDSSPKYYTFSPYKTLNDCAKED